MAKLCVLFPGVGYTNLKPLLYYSGKIAIHEGYELLQINYSNLPVKIGRDKEKMKEAFEIALSQAEDQLSQVRWDEYEDIIFVGKSIGTVIAAASGKGIKAKIKTEIHEKKNLVETTVNIRYIYLTPLKDTFTYAESRSGIAFFGDADPWSEMEDIVNGTHRLEIPLHIYEGGNHSLETGEVKKDIEILGDVMKYIKEYITSNKISEY